MPPGTYAVAVDPQTDTAYAANEEGSVSVINAQRRHVLATLPVDTPYAVAVDPQTATACVASQADNTVTVIGSLG
jgi:YVTN family beta-propeller protein